MKRLIIATLVMGVALLGLQAQASANMLLSPGFDAQAAGALTWTTSPWMGGGGGEEVGIPPAPVAGGGAVILPNYPNPLSSPKVAQMYLWDNTNYGTWAWAATTQIVSGVITPGQTYLSQAYLRRDSAMNDATAVLKVKWMDQFGTPVGATAVGAIQFGDSDPINTWTLVSEAFIAPNNPVVTQAEYQIVYSKDPGSSIGVGPVFADNASFDVIPEPATMLLFGSGLVGLFGFSRRKRS